MFDQSSMISFFLFVLMTCLVLMRLPGLHSHSPLLYCSAPISTLRETTMQYFYYSFGGIKWDRDNVKIFHVNMCTYFSKGMADYVGVWDFDEFFQPRGMNKNLLDVIAAMEPLDGPIQYTYPPDVDPIVYFQTPFIPRRGMADMDGHPFCYLILKSEVTYIAKALNPYAPKVGQLSIMGMHAFINNSLHSKTF